MQAKLKLTKMQGLGNDFLVLYGEPPTDCAALAKRLCDRHFGVGADGLLVVTASECADFRMQIYNADGSRARMCGNGIRCVGKYVYDRGLTQKTTLSIETDAGLRQLALHVRDGRVESVSVDMGVARVSARQEGGWFVDVGNPHLVLFVPDAEQEPLSERGARLSASVPGGVNVELVSALPDGSLRMRVWERGSGITLACGTGACATAAAAGHAGICPAGEPITVRLDGGCLRITARSDGSVRMEGPAVTVLEGEVLL